MSTLTTAAVSHHPQRFIDKLHGKYPGITGDWAPEYSGEYSGCYKNECEIGDDDLLHQFDKVELPAVGNYRNLADAKALQTPFVSGDWHPFDSSSMQNFPYIELTDELLAQYAQ